MQQDRGRSPSTATRARTEVPAQRRVARRVPAQSPQAVLLAVVRDALEPHWSPTESAQRLRTEVSSEVGVLRQARVRLRAATTERITVSQARALATLNLAIHHGEDDTEVRGDGGATP